MSLRRREVTMRIDRDAVEVFGSFLGRSRKECTPVPVGADVFEVAETVLGTSSLLRPGRECQLDIVVESERTVYRTVDGAEGEAQPMPGRRIEVDLPDGLVDVLVPVLSRRRVHGPTSLIAGPIERTLRTMEARIDHGKVGRGLIIDRSSAAVTVVLVDEARIPWARGGPAQDPLRAVELLVGRAAALASCRSRLDWWHLEDVAVLSDERARHREARGFEAACDALVGHLPRIPVAPS